MSIDGLFILYTVYTVGSEVNRKIVIVLIKILIDTIEIVFTLKNIMMEILTKKLFIITVIGYLEQ